MILTRTFYSLDFLWPDNRFCRRDFLLEGQNTEVQIPFKAPLRGFYKLLPALRIEDPLGFFGMQIPLPSSETRTVIDHPEGEQDIREPRISFSRIQTQKKDTDEELFEIRPYFPGDDPRKLNWKLLAHSGDLFIRQGEDGTPYLSKIYCVLNTEIQDIPRKTQLLWTDALVRGFHSLLLELQQKPLEIYVALPGMENFKELSQLGNIDEKLASAGSQKLSLKTKQIKDGPVILFSYAYSESLKTWLQNCSARDISLMLKKPPFKEEKSWGILKKASELLFMDTEERSPEELSRRKLKKLQNGYESVSGSFNGKGGCYVLHI